MRALEGLLNVSVPRESHTERAIARNKAITDMTVPFIISNRAGQGSQAGNGRGLPSSHPGACVMKYLVYRRAATSRKARVTVT